jgi:hypothetical protein
MAKKKGKAAAARRKGRKKIGSEIKRQKRNGKKKDQAVAIALSEARRGELGRSAKKAPPRKKKAKRKSRR